MKCLSFKKIATLVTISTVFSSLAIISSTLLFPQPATAQGCGVKDGYPLPCWTDFLDDGEGNESLPQYPYAKRPNGCSIPFGRPGEYDNLGALGYNFSFREVCNQHDHCYYTLGTRPEDCNSAFAMRLTKVCKDGETQLPRNITTGVGEVLSGGGSRANAIRNCYERAKHMSEVTIAVQYKYHPAAQNIQKRYLRKVAEYIAASRPRTINGEPAFIFNDDPNPFIVTPNPDNPVIVQPSPGRPNCDNFYVCAGIDPALIPSGRGDYDSE
jgi:hypothetical protein